MASFWIVPISLNQRNSQINILLKKFQNKNILQSKIYLPQKNLDPNQLFEDDKTTRELVLSQGECPICFMIVRDPVDCNKCDTTYCQTCAQNNI